MLYQLIAYYTTNAAAGKTLWDYIGWTVIIFQNAAFLEVSVAQMIFCYARPDAVVINFLLMVRHLIDFRITLQLSTFSWILESIGRD